MDCWMKEECRAAQSGNCDGYEDCKCAIACDELFKSALLPAKYKPKMQLNVPNSDLACYLQLNYFQQNVSRFVHSGIHNCKIDQHWVAHEDLSQPNIYKNIYICSRIPGNGKTTWAARICRSYIMDIWPRSGLLDCKVLFINVPRFLNALKCTYGSLQEQEYKYAEYIKNNIYTADLVVWDDIATKQATEFEAEQLYIMINARVDANKSNIYTSNRTTFNELSQVVGDRIASRILNINDTLRVEFTGTDTRVTQYKTEEVK